MSTPVIASHAGARFGKLAYMLEEETIEQIHHRDGVIGLIAGRHLLQDGLGEGSSMDNTIHVISCHIDKIHRITGSHKHVCIGSDLDGFIKPTMTGLKSSGDLASLEPAIRKLYPRHADDILFGNALRMVRRALAGR